MTQIIDVQWMPPGGKDWLLLHWTRASELQDAVNLLQPSVVYRDRGGSYWFPVESETE